MEKKLTRAKLALAGSKDLFTLAGPGDVAARLPAVLRVLYLLFNEGYHGASSETPIRADLCKEAMRLVGLLFDNPLTATPAAHALAALMYFLAARLPGRLDAEGNAVSQRERSWSTSRRRFLSRKDAGSWNCRLQAIS